MSPRKRGWEPIPRALIEDSRLQFDTRGFANWLIARPDGWQIRIGALPYLLRKQAAPGERMGRDRVRRFIRELKSAGYLRMSQSRTATGRWVWQVEFSDTPDAPGQHSTIDGLAVDGSATDGAAVDGQGVDLLQTLNNSKLNKTTPTTTPEAETDKEPGVVGPLMEIRYPGFLQGAVLESARLLIDACPISQRQSVLDELGAMNVRGKVRRPVGLLKTLIERAKTGQFVPNCSLSLSRTQAQPSALPMPERALSERSECRSPAMASVSEVGRKTLSGIREKLAKP